MRRKDREMNREFGLELIDRSSYGIMSLVDGESAYGVPLSFAREGEYLYFHSGKEGRKVELLRGNPKVSIAFVGNSQVPDIYSGEELDEIARDEARYVNLISRVFTTEFSSAIVEGRVEEVQIREEKILALEYICKKYTPDKMEYFPLAIKAGLEKVRIYKVEIESLASKRKKYDSYGEEMKWGRME